MKKVFFGLIFILSLNGGLLRALTQNQVSMLYVTIFNRASEGEGNRYWQTQGTLAEVANRMLETEDAKNYFGNSLNSDQSFVEWIYKNTLNKSYYDDPDGIEYWVNDLKRGSSRGELVASLVNAAIEDINAGEAQKQFKNRIEVSNYMANVLELAPINYKTSTNFNIGLIVNSNPNSVASAKIIVDNMAKNELITLTDNVKKSSYVSLDKWKYYKININSYEKVKIILDNLSGDIDLYIKKGSKPTLEDFDYISLNNNIEAENLNFYTDATTLYIGVYGYEGGNYNIQVKIGNRIYIHNTSELRNALKEASLYGDNYTLVLSKGIYKTTDDNKGSFKYSSNTNNHKLIITSVNGLSNKDVIISGEYTNRVFNLSGSSSNTIEIDNITIEKGHSEGIGGGGILANIGNFIIKDSIINNNYSNSFGGGISFTGNKAKLVNTTISYNYSSNGGGVFLFCNSAYVNKTIIKSNYSISQGGGLLIEATNALVNDSKFYNNTAYEGGALISKNTILMNSIFSNNEGTDDYKSFVSLGYKSYIINNNFINNDGSVYAYGVFINNLFNNNYNNIVLKYDSTIYNNYIDFNKVKLVDNYYTVYKNNNLYSNSGFNELFLKDKGLNPESIQFEYIIDNSSIFNKIIDNMNLDILGSDRVKNGIIDIGTIEY